MNNNPIKKLKEVKDILENYLLEIDSTLQESRFRQVDAIIEELDIFIYEDENCLIEEEEEE